jgi:Domain of unknown function (DUF4115)
MFDLGQADAVRNAEREAARIIRDAEQRADRILKERDEYAERQFDRLRTLRRDIGTLLESSVSALRVVEHLLPREASATASASDSIAGRARVLFASPESLRFAAVLAAGIAIGSLLGAGALYSVMPQPVASIPTPEPRAVSAPSSMRVPAARMAPEPTSASPIASSGETTPKLAQPSATAGQSTALTVVLSAERQCWVRATIDGTQVLERLLEPYQELRLQAREGVMLRIGDAGAVSATINGKPAARFGRAGQVITRQITLKNYSQLLAGLS